MTVTDIASEQSRVDIERTLKRHHADSYMYGFANNKASLVFTMSGVMIRMEITLPDPNAKEFRLTPSTGRTRSTKSQQDAYEQVVRQRWRALAVALRGKLDAVGARISTVEQEFLAFIVTPEGSTVGDQVIPKLAKLDGAVHYALLPGASDGAP